MTTTPPSPGAALPGPDRRSPWDRPVVIDPRSRSPWPDAGGWSPAPRMAPAAAPARVDAQPSAHQPEPAWWDDRPSGAGWTARRSQESGRSQGSVAQWSAATPGRIAPQVPGAPSPVAPAPVAPSPVAPSRRPLVAVSVIVALVVLAAVATVGGIAIGRALPVAEPTSTSGTAAPTAGPTRSSSRTRPTPSRSASPTPTRSATDPSSAATPGDPDIYRDADVLVTNPFYRRELGPFECSALSMPIPTGRAFETWTPEAMRCIHRFFSPAIVAAGAEPSPPRVRFFTDQVDSPCGSGSGAFYCAGDTTIYIQRGVYDAREGWRLNPLRMLIHEYTHHLQGRVGILSEARQLDREDNAQISRRIELQAACWSEMVMRGSETLEWTDDDEEQLEAFNSVDSDSRHGRASSRMYWYAQARGERSMGSCNTWDAPPERVR